MRSSSIRRAQISRADCTFGRVFGHRRFSAAPRPRTGPRLLPSARASAPASAPLRPPFAHPARSQLRSHPPHPTARSPPPARGPPALPPAPLAAGAPGRARAPPSAHPLAHPGFATPHPPPAASRIPARAPFAHPHHHPRLHPLPARAASVSPGASRRPRGAVLQQGVLHISHGKDGPARGRPWFPFPGGVKRKWAYCATGYPVFHVCENTTRYVFMRHAGRGLSPCRMFEGRVV